MTGRERIAKQDYMINSLLNTSMLTAFRIGASLFCSRLKYTSSYFVGTTSGAMHAGIEMKAPVNGGESLSSR
jgi:hypothetical protein